jgi:hypothetical protein
MSYQLRSLGLHAGFEIPICNLRGIIVSKNECAICCRIERANGGIDVVYWAPATEVEIADVSIREENVVGGGELKCVCGKVCSSTSGLTLHKKSCDQAKTPPPQ